MRRTGLAVAVGGLLLVGLAVAAVAILPEVLRSRIEKALSDETGMAWEIGSASLRPDLTLELQKVSGTDPAARSLPLVSFESLRLSAPLNLVFGASGTVDAKATGFAAHISANVSSASARSSAFVERLSDITVAANGLRYALADDARAFGVTAKAVDTTLRFGESPARTRKMSVVIDSDDGTIRIEARQANPGRLILADADISVSREARAGEGVRVQVAGVVGIDASRYRFASLRGSIDDGAFDGSASVDLTGLPAVRWDLHFARLALIDDLGSSVPQRPRRDGTMMVRASALQEIDLGWLDRIDVAGIVRVDEASIGKAQAGGVVAEVTAKAGGVDVAVTAQRFYGGNARARYVLTKPPQRRGDHQLALAVAQARAQPLLSDMIGVNGVDGETSIRVDLVASGERLNDAVRSATGQGNLAITDGSLNGLDLASKAGLSTGGLGQSAAGLVKTRFDQLTGTFKIGDGVAVTNDLRFSTPLVDTIGSGAVDMTAKTLDFRLQPALVSGGKRVGGVNIPVRIAGPWTAPAVSADLSGVMANPGASVQTLRDLGGLLNKDGALGTGGLGGLLDGLMPKGGKLGR